MADATRTLTIVALALAVSGCAQPVVDTVVLDPTKRAPSRNVQILVRESPERAYRVRGYLTSRDANMVKSTRPVVPLLDSRTLEDDHREALLTRARVMGCDAIEVHDDTVVHAPPKGFPTQRVLIAFGWRARCLTFDTEEPLVTVDEVGNARPKAAPDAPKRVEDVAIYDADHPPPTGSSHVLARLSLRQGPKWMPRGAFDHLHAMRSKAAALGCDAIVLERPSMEADESCGAMLGYPRECIPHHHAACIARDPRSSR